MSSFNLILSVSLSMHCSLLCMHVGSVHQIQAFQMKAVTLFLQVHFSSFFAVDENHGCVQDLGAEQLVQLVKTVKGAGSIKTSDDGPKFQSIVGTRK